MPERYIFVNGWRSTLAGSGIIASATLLTPSTTIDFPVCDPTATDPNVVPLAIDTDPLTGEPTANTEIVKVVDTRTVPWSVVRADETVAFGVPAGAPIDHPSGVPIAAVASAAALGALINPPFTGLSGVSGWDVAADGDYARWSGGALVPMPGDVPGLLLGYSRNASGVADPKSTVPSSGVMGNPVTVTDGSGNPLTVTIPANVGRAVMFDATVPMARDPGTQTTITMFLTISETADHDAALTANALNKVQFLSAPITVPVQSSGNFSAQIRDCYMAAAEFPIDRKFYLGYTIYNATGAAGNVGAWVQAVNTADTFTAVPGYTVRQGSRLSARLV